MKDVQELLQATGSDDQLAICRLDKQGRVQFQNGACQSLCGDRCGRNCNDGCRELGNSSDSQEKPAVFLNRSIHSRFCDVVLLPVVDGKLVLLSLRNQSLGDLLERFHDCDLSKREAEVLSFMARGMSNSEIALRLGISRGTLKTHINRIYKKVGDRAPLLKRLGTEAKAAEDQGA